MDRRSVLQSILASPVFTKLDVEPQPRTNPVQVSTKPDDDLKRKFDNVKKELDTWIGKDYHDFFDFYDEQDYIGGSEWLQALNKISDTLLKKHRIDTEKYCFYFHYILNFDNKETWRIIVGFDKIKLFEKVTEETLTFYKREGQWKAII